MGASRSVGVEAEAEKSARASGRGQQTQQGTMEGARREAAAEAKESAGSSKAARAWSESWDRRCVVSSGIRYCLIFVGVMLATSVFWLACAAAACCCTAEFFFRSCSNWRARSMAHSTWVATLGIWTEAEAETETEGGAE